MPDCPSADDLKNYALGKLVKDRVDDVERHIDTCDLCQSTLDTISFENDELIRAMRFGRDEKTQIVDSSWKEAEELVKAIGQEWSRAGEASSDTAALPIERLRDYDLLEELGQGGMGTVYKAVHTKLKKVVALKVLPADRMENEEAVRRFEREMQAVGQLHHPHIVQATDAGEVDGTHYLVMEYVEGLNLSELVEKRGPLPVAEACELIRQAALGLQHAHEHGMVHRDIKPSNLMLTAAAQVKILDLGLALLCEGPAAGAELTTTNQIMGTLNYMAPEQAADTHTVDIRADLYSLGATLYKLLSGKAPLHDAGGNSPARQLNALLNTSPESIREHRPDVPEPLAELVARLLAKDPGQRPATPAELITELEPFAEGADVGQLMAHPQDGTQHTKRIALATASSVNVSSHLIETDIEVARDSHAETEIQPAERSDQPPAPPRRRVGLGMWGLFAAVLLLGVWLIIRDKDGNEKARIKLEPGDQMEVVEADGKNVQPVQPKDVGEIDYAHEREVAEWVLSIGGSVDIIEKNKPLSFGSGDKLPDSLFSVYAVNLNKNLVGEDNLEEINGTQLASIIRLHDLKGLILHCCPIGDDFLQELSQSSSLRRLDISGTSVSNDAIASLDRQKNLQRLNIAGTKVTDAGLAHLTECSSLEMLTIDPTLLTDKAVKVLNRIPHLSDLRFVTVADNMNVRLLERISNLKHLTVIHLEGIHHLTMGDVTQLHERFPGLQIVWDGGVIGPESPKARANFDGKIPTIGELPKREDGFMWTDYWPEDAPSPAIAPFNTKQAEAYQKAWADYLELPVEFENSIGMRFRLIPPGEFMMGSTPEEIEAALKVAGEEEHWQECIRSEAPQHKVIQTKAIYLGKNEVTQAEYEQAMGINPSHFAANGEGKDAVTNLETDNHPVEMVSWNDAAEFCAILSQTGKLKPFYFRAGETVTPLDGTGYRLPTEAEWEFACRAGTTTKYWIGDQDDDLVPAGWFGANSGRRTHAVNALKANPLGLSDIHGNAWEWVQDGWNPTFYDQFTESAAVDPSAPFSSNSRRVFRGGSWRSNPSYCRSSYRDSLTPTDRSAYISFRVMLPVESVKERLRSDQNLDNPANYALSFDGVDDYVEIPTLKPAEQLPVTVEMWVTPEKTPDQYQRLFSNPGPTSLWINNTDGAPAPGLGEFMKQDGPRPYELIFGQINAPKMNSELEPRQHIAAVFTDGSVSLFVNGEHFQTLAERALGYHHLLSKLPRGSFIAADPLGGFMVNNFFKGELDELRISSFVRYNEDFTPVERFETDEHTVALYHFDEGKGDVLKDSSGNDHHGKIHGATWVNLTERERQQQLRYDRDRQIAQQLLDNNATIGITYTGENEPHIIEPGNDLLNGLFTVSIADISKVAFLDEVLPILAQATELEQLQAMGTSITPDQMRVLAPLSKVKKLNLRESNTITNELMAVVAEQFLSLEYLDLSYSRLPDNGINGLASLSRLDKIDMRGTENTDPTLHNLATYPNQLGLHVILSDASWETIYELINAPVRHQVEFSASAFVFEQGGAYAVTKNGKRTAHHPGGKSFSTGWSHIDELDFSNTNISNQSFEWFSSQSPTPHQPRSLKALNLSNTSITDGALFRFSGLPLLEKVYVSKTELTDQGVLELTAFPAIKSVDLRGTKATPSAIAYLNERKPDCEFLSDFSEEEIENATPLFAFDPAVPETSPFDHLKRDDIDPYELTVAGDGDPANAPEELVGIFGDSRLRHAPIRGLTHLLFSKDGKALISGASDGRVIVWNVESGEMQRQIHTGKSILSLNHGPTAKSVLVNGLGDQKDAVYDYDSGLIISEISDHVGCYQSVSEQGEVAVGTDMSGATHFVWKMNPPSLLYHGNGHPNAPGKAAMQPQGRLFATAGGNGIAKVWDVRNGEELLAFTEHTSPVTRIAFSADGERVISGADNGELFCWSAKSGDAIWKSEPIAPRRYVTAISPSPDGRYVAVSNAHGELVIYNAQSGAAETLATDSKALSIVFSPDSQMLAACSGDGQICVWDIERRKKLNSDFENRAKATGSCISENGRYIGIAEADGTVTVRDSATGDIIQRKKLDYTITAIAIHERNDLVAIGAGTGSYSVHLYLLSTGEKLSVSRALTNTAETLQFSPDGSKLIVSTSQQQVFYLDPYSLEALQFIRDEATGPGNDHVISQDGKSVVAAHRYQTNRGFSLLDPVTGKVNYTSPEIESTISDLTLSRDGKTLAIALVEKQNSIQLWDLVTKTKITEYGDRLGNGDFSLKQGNNSRLTFSPNGKKLYAAFDEGEVEVWDLDKIDNPEEARSVIKVGGPMDGFYGLHIDPAGKHLITHNGNDTFYVLRLKPEHRGVSVAE